MAQSFDLVLRGGACVTPGGIVRADIDVWEGRSVAIGDVEGRAVEVVHCAAKLSNKPEPLHLTTPTVRYAGQHLP